jgi:catechol 2,3-dioxygenase-like lactoylglutathione lyase family enzyme
MEYVIANLVRDFEKGKLSRRELIRTLALTVTAASAASASTAPVSAAPVTPATEGKGFQAIAVNHISYRVADYARTRDFYADLLGMKISGDNGKQCDLSFGQTFIIPRMPRQPGGTPNVDHFAITIANWNKDAVEEELKRRGLEPRPDTENSFHIKDPDGYDLQISGEGMKPEP